MEIYPAYVAAARVGAAFPGARSPWASLSVAGRKHARTQTPVPAAGTQGAHRAAFLVVAAMTQQLAVTADEPLAVNGTRKQNVHKTA